MLDRDRQIELLYKNLEYVSAFQFASEGRYPYWESAFSLIIGQILIAYYGQGICSTQQLVLALFGLILSLIWFIVVSLTLQNARYIDDRLKNLDGKLKSELSSYGMRHEFEFIEPDPNRDVKNSWTLGNIFWGDQLGIKTYYEKEYYEKGGAFKQLKKLIRSTWFYRRMLPFILCLIWIYLIAATYLAPLAILILVVIAFVLRYHKSSDDRH